MNRLSQSEVFRSLVDGGAISSIVKTALRPDMLAKYSIPYEFYSDKIKSLQTKSYTLLKPTLEAAKQGKVKLFNFADPLDRSLKSQTVPFYFTTLIGANANGTHSAYVNSEAKGGFEPPKNPIMYKIDENALYAYLQTGWCALIVYDKDTIVTNDTTLTTYCAEAYSSLMANILNEIYPVSAELDGFQKTAFIFAMFFFQFHCGYSVEKALNLVQHIRSIEFSTIKERCKIYANQDLAMTSYSECRDRLVQEFPFIHPEQISIRTVTGQIIKRCGKNAMFVPEHFQSFLNMIEAVDLRANFYFDKYVRRCCPDVIVDKINERLLRISLGS